MPKRDSLREFITTARKAYLLAHTPPPASVYREIKDDNEAEVDGMHGVEARMVLLRHGIDVKYAVNSFIKEIRSKHGIKRAERILYWIDTGSMYSFSRRHRQEIKADRKRLWEAVHKTMNRNGSGKG